MTHSVRSISKGVHLTAILALLMLMALPVLFMVVWANGSFIIRDRDNVVAEVFIRNSLHEAHASRFFFGLWWTTARLEGEAVVRCSNGVELNFGYITSATHVWETITGGTCRPEGPPVRIIG